MLLFLYNHKQVNCILDFFARCGKTLWAPFGPAFEFLRHPSLFSFDSSFCGKE